MSRRSLPERLNLAIARRCDVACNGCYTYFGKGEPDLALLLPSVAAFVILGIEDVTLSGGDPLTISGSLDLLSALRSLGVRSIKLDTVGVGLSGPGLRELIARTDYIGIPLDGWSDQSVLEFRRGRSRLYGETIALLDTIDSLGGPPKVIINTVAHGRNLPHLDRIHAALGGYSCVCQWNIFQYTPTDQAARGANAKYAVGDEAFERSRERLLSNLASSVSQRIEFRSTRSRLGQYLLINSDGEAWLPDEAGCTLRLGSVFGREREVLEGWRETSAALLRRAGVSERSTLLLQAAKA